MVGARLPTPIVGGVPGYRLGYRVWNDCCKSYTASDTEDSQWERLCDVYTVQVSYTFCCDFISLLMKSAGSSDEFGPTEVVVQGLKKVSNIGACHVKHLDLRAYL